MVLPSSCSSWSVTDVVSEGMGAGFSSAAGVAGDSAAGGLWANSGRAAATRKTAYRSRNMVFSFRRILSRIAVGQASRPANRRTIGKNEPPHANRLAAGLHRLLGRAVFWRLVPGFAGAKLDPPGHVALRHQYPGTRHANGQAALARRNPRARTKHGRNDPPAIHRLRIYPELRGAVHLHRDSAMVLGSPLDRRARPRLRRSHPRRAGLRRCREPRDPRRHRTTQPSRLGVDPPALARQVGLRLSRGPAAESVLSDRTGSLDLSAPARAHPGPGRHPCRTARIPELDHWKREGSRNRDTPITGVDACHAAFSLVGKHRRNRSGVNPRKVILLASCVTSFRQLFR